MKQLLLLGVMFSLFFFSCKTAADSDSQQDISPEKETPESPQIQETYIEVINNSVYPIDLYSSSTRDTYSLIGANIAPNNNYKILVTNENKEQVYYVVFHIRIAELDVPYWDNDSALIIAVRKGELSKGKVLNPTIDVGHVSWLILENRSPFGLRIVKNSLELVPENRSEESSLLNTEEFGVYKVYASEFDNLKIKRAFGSAEISFPFTEIKSGKIYKLAVDDDLKCNLESTYSFNSKIVYQYPENYLGEKITEKSVVIGETLTAEKHLPTLPSEIGYIFDGWYNGDQLITEGYIIQDNITLTPKWNRIYKIEYELNGGENNPENNITSYTIKDILDTEDSKLTIELKNPTRNIDEFSGWYENENFSGKPVTKITIDANSLRDVKVYAKWIDKTKIFDFAEIKGSSDYVNGILTVNPTYEKITFKGNSSETFNNLCIKVSNANAKVVFDNFSFNSSKTAPLIESSSDILIEYTGYNKLTSSAMGAVSLIKCLGTIEFRAKDNSSKLELQPNIVTDSNIYSGSTGVTADKVIIHGGNFVINKSDGWNNSTKGRKGGDGSSGIKASETVIKNNAVVTIEAGNGSNGNTQIERTGQGESGSEKSSPGGYGGEGGRGEQGITGPVGGNGGVAIDGNLDVITGTVTLKGGNGGKGGKGGRGQKGGKGGDATGQGAYTGQGGKGGTGGTGGKGGNGGNAISGTLQTSVSVNITAGTRGEGGLGGEGGEGGTPGEVRFFWSHQSGSYGASGDSGRAGEPGMDGIKHR